MRLQRSWLKNSELSMICPRPSASPAGSFGQERACAELSLTELRFEVFNLSVVCDVVSFHQSWTFRTPKLMN